MQNAFQLAFFAWTWVSTTLTTNQIFCKINVKTTLVLFKHKKCVDYKCLYFNSGDRKIISKLSLIIFFLLGNTSMNLG